MNSTPEPNNQTYALGLDVGGTKIAAGLVAFPAGRVIVKQIIPTRPERSGQAVLADALNLAETFIAQAAAESQKVVGIGVGVAELVDLAGNVTSSHTIAWRGLPVQAAFSELAPTVVESDVRAPALAEAIFGAGQPFKLFIYVTVGTGISYSLVQEGRPYAGARGNALIMASSPLTTICTTCGSVLKPVLDEFASGPALVARYNQARALAPKEANLESRLQSGPHATTESRLQFGLLPTGQVARGEELLAAVEAGDALAIDVVKTAGQALGVSVGWLVNVLDPESVIVGGGLGLAGGLYWSSFVAATREHIWSDTNRELPILPAALGVDAGLIGAAATIYQKERPGGG
jgi:glucokinase